MTGCRRPLARLALAAALVALASPLPAQISPGPLSQPHAGLDGSRNCLACHRAGKGVDPVLCLDCHKALGARLAAGKGLHARAGHERCERCHSEHQGAGFALVFWGKAGRDAFDHREADWPLVGKHAQLRCAECHRADRLDPALAKLEPKLDRARTFLGQPTSCVGCHRDPHLGALAPAACTDCHSQTSWKPAGGFDHARTRYPLTGAHLKAPCLKCHAQEAGTAASAEKTVVLSQFKGQPAPACARCHADVHKGRLGSDCARCHTTERFTTAAVPTGGFDHERTSYPLRGLHRRVECAKCHTPGRELRIPKFERCETCHRDVHLGQLAKAGGSGGCVTCHSVDGFTPARYGPEEHSRSAFKLEAAHLAVPCTACHRTVAPSTLPPQFALRSGPPVVRYRFAATACRDCHQDPHGGKLDRFAGTAGCAACHAQAAWRPASFDHEKSRYPLRGKHVAVECSKCHPRGADGKVESMKLRDLALDCAGCHRDPHAGQLARAGVTACERCHAVDGWRPAAGFDHQRDSRYALDGAHRKVACAACHASETIGADRVVRYKPLPVACEGCHKGIRSAGTGTSR